MAVLIDPPDVSKLYIRDLTVTSSASEPRMEVKLITPAVACALLARNPRNRNLSKSRVSRLANAMARGEWALNGETIKIDTNGNLLDGQHRLAAVEMHGKPVQFCVITGISPDFMDTIDVGAKRSFADLLMINGCGKWSVLIAAMTLGMFEWENDVKAGGKATHHLLESTLKAHPLLPTSTEFAWRIAKWRKMIISAAGIAYTLTAEVNETAARLFVEQFITGAELKEGDPRLALSRYLLIDRGAKIAGRTKRIFELWAYIKAWNAWCKGEEMRGIRFVNGEQKPKLLAPRPL